MNKLIYITFFISLLWISCNAVVTLPDPPVMNCNCDAPDNFEIIAVDSSTAVIKWKMKTGFSDYQISLKDIENAQFFIKNIHISDSLAIFGTDTLRNLTSSTTYSVRVATQCNNPLICTETWVSAPTNALLFATDNVSGCEEPVNFAIYDVVSDTLKVAWQASTNTQDFRVFVADSVGNLVFQANYSSLAMSVNNYFVVKTGLPKGDYTVWVESICTSGASNPSNIGVFKVIVGGGDPVVIIEDNIDVYNASNCNNCLVQLPEYTASETCIPARSVTFLNLPMPKQVIVGYKMANNTNASCAPTTPNFSRLRSYKVSPIYMNTNDIHYRISIPKMGCVCVGEKYFLSVLANAQYQPLNMSNPILQYCGSCQ